MIELISIHIAKTGGQSFYEILKKQYGDALDPRYKRVHYFPNKDYSKPLIDRIPEKIKVLHGHLLYAHIEAIHKRDHAKIITWFRDPVERVISNYFFLMQRLREDASHPHYRKYNYSLLQYAEESIQNKMSFYLKGIPLEELFFFGFLEDFEKGLHLLSAKLAWKQPIDAVHINKSATKEMPTDITTPKESITEAMRDRIRELNQDDVALYNRARNLYKQRFDA